MLIICDKNPYIATNYLYHHTNKNFWFKQLLELARYKQGYKCDYNTDAELPIETACNEYKKYLDWKFKSNG